MIWKLLSPSSTDVPALLPCAMLPRQARVNAQKQSTKPNLLFILPLSIYNVKLSPILTEDLLLPELLGLAGLDGESLLHLPALALHVLEHLRRVLLARVRSHQLVDQRVRRALV